MKELDYRGSGLVQYFINLKHFLLYKKRNLNIQYMIRRLLEIENGIKFHCTKPYVILMMAFVQKRTYDFIKQ